MKRVHSMIFMITLPFNQNHDHRGFTLVELVVAMAAGALVLTAVMTSFLSQHRHYLAQDNVVEMQQNGRVAMDMLARDIRTAGFDPNDLGAGITTAGSNNLVFTREDDLVANGLETLSYSLFDAFSTGGSPTNDGLIDDLALETTTAAGTTGGRQVVAENISQLEFRYLDENGRITTTPADVRSILIFMLAVASQPDPNYTNSIDYTYTYTSPDGTSTATINSPPNNDNFRRRSFITIIKCRNAGL